MQNGKSYTLFVAHFFCVSYLSAFAYLEQNSSVQKFANANNILGHYSSLSLSLSPISISSFFFSSTDSSRARVMAARLAVVLEKRQSSEVLQSFLELLSSFLRFIIVVRRCGAFHKRSFVRLHSSPRNYSSTLRRAAPCDALKEIKRGAFIRDKLKS